MAVRHLQERLPGARRAHRRRGRVQGWPLRAGLSRRALWRVATAAKQGCRRRRGGHPSSARRRPRRLRQFFLIKPASLGASPAVAVFRHFPYLVGVYREKACDKRRLKEPPPLPRTKIAAHDHFQFRADHPRARRRAWAEA
ncbi:hypothetical protein MPLSOD_110010 [Mesorhizobium sp. SOD10]|nr:hypothetical protein MPLSOD_110010 [Mesorhizobium sp. SOD10]